ncbi:MAG: nuclear transport factor 2 family protein [Bacteroidota bacterium]
MKLFFPFLILFPFISFSQDNHQKIKQELLALHHQERVFHFEKRATEFANYLSENIISVNSGEVRQPTRTENKNRIEDYFNRVEFIEWDDVAEPIIQISEDGKMAYVVVQKKVSVKYGKAEDALQGTTEFAWVSIYEKENKEWKITCNISTNKAPVFNKKNMAQTLNEDGLEVLQALEKFSQAYREADTKTLADLLTEKYVHSNSGGAIIRKKSWLNWVASRKKLIDHKNLIYTDYFNEDVVVEIYGDAAVVHGINISEGTERGNPFYKKIAFTHTWIKENDQWKRASFHDSKINNKEDEVAIRKINGAYLANWLENNQAGVLNLFEEGARISPSSLCPIDSLSNMRQFWFPNDGATTTIHRFEADELSLKIINAELACTTQKTFLEWSYEKEEIKMGRIQEGIELTVFRKQKNGDWKIWRKLWTDVVIKER